MRSFSFGVDPANGSLVMTLTSDQTHTCTDFTGEEFDYFAKMVATVHLESKAARS